MYNIFLNNNGLLVFYYLCYEGSMDLNNIQDWYQKYAFEVQIMEFGQIPKQLFKDPHPPKTCLLFKDFKQTGIILFLLITYLHRC